MTIDSLKAVVHAVEHAGFSAENVAYGMGAGLLQVREEGAATWIVAFTHPPPTR